LRIEEVIQEEKEEVEKELEEEEEEEEEAEAEEAEEAEAEKEAEDSLRIRNHDFKYNPLFSTARCPNPGIPLHGFQRNSSSSFFKHGSQVTFGCGNTYSLQGQQTIECRDGRWSHDIPKCLGK
jgi:hypothetical protein